MVTRKSLLPLTLAVAALAFGLPLAGRADDQVRSAQENLKNLGFYTGPVDGALNADTKGAVRRFQMNHELNATGDLDSETLAALKGADQETAAPAPTPATPEPLRIESATPAPSAPPAAEDERDLRRDAGPGTPAAPAAPPRAPGEAAAFEILYTHTPYQKAPPEVQRDTLRKAQTALAQRRLYGGEINGLPGPDTEEALIRFQSAKGLQRTGRLDIDTLAELRLLPVTHLLKPFRSSPPVYEGRAPRPRPDGAVRGIPLD